MTPCQTVGHRLRHASEACPTNGHRLRHAMLSWIAVGMLALAAVRPSLMAADYTGLWLATQVTADDILPRLHDAGFRLSARQLSDLNRACISGAVLSLSGDGGVASPFASAAFVSADGLVLTNYHTVSSYAERATASPEVVAAEGYWATSASDELPLYGLEVHQMLSCADVTAEVQAGSDTIADADRREQYVDQRARRLMDSRRERYGITRKVYSLMGGEQYIMVRYRTFGDVRLVACPPAALGLYGGSSDNWRWPRHACDFALLRVYAAGGTSSSYYTPRNLPYRPTSWLRLARRAPQPGQPALIVGYPASTRKHIPATAIDRIVEADTRLRADFVQAKADLLRQMHDTAAAASRPAYEARIRALDNVLLRSLGEIEGVKRHQVVDRRRALDLRLQDWINADTARTARYGHNLVYRMDTVYLSLSRYNHATEAFGQLVNSGPTVIPLAGKFEKLVAIDRAQRKTRARDMEHQLVDTRRNVAEYFTKVRPAEDLAMLQRLMPLYCAAMPADWLPERLQPFAESADGLADTLRVLFERSILTDRARLDRMLDQAVDSGMAPLTSDPLYRLCLDLYAIRVRRLMREETQVRRLNTRLYHAYCRAMTEMSADGPRPFDANHTMRFSPGHVTDVTGLADIAARTEAHPGEADYALPPRLRSLVDEADAPLPTACFTTDAETASGSSGSPVVDARGRLVGLAFDRTAESAYSIYVAQPDSVQSIAVSADYILWVLAHYAPTPYPYSALCPKRRHAAR